MQQRSAWAAAAALTADRCCEQGGYVTLAEDGHDVVEWLAAQDWCTGQVGSFGGSQAGFAQNLLASQAPPSLVCQ